MNVVRGMVLVGAAVLVSGCAGGRQARDLGRLQSQIALLDDRVGQLERSQFPLPAAEEAEMAAAGAATTASPASETAQASKAAPEPKASLKPTTRQIQQALKNAGFYQSAIDGKMGPMTREAIREFQRVHGLVDDGVVGKKTWAKLHAYSDLSAGSNELNAAEVLK